MLASLRSSQFAAASLSMVKTSDVASCVGSPSILSSVTIRCSPQSGQVPSKVLPAQLVADYAARTSVRFGQVGAWWLPGLPFVTRQCSHLPEGAEDADAAAVGRVRPAGAATGGVSAKYKCNATPNLTALLLSASVSAALGLSSFSATWVPTPSRLPSPGRVKRP